MLGIIGVKNNEVSRSYCNRNGQDNEVSRSYCNRNGQDNKVSWSYYTVNGHNKEVSLSYCTVNGQHNEVSWSYCTVNGHDTNEPAALLSLCSVRMHNAIKYKISIIKQNAFCIQLNI